MDSKDYVIDKLAKEKAQLEVNNIELEFAIMVLQQENEKLKKEIEDANGKLNNKNSIMNKTELVSEQ